MGKVEIRVKQRESECPNTVDTAKSWAALAFTFFYPRTVRETDVAVIVASNLARNVASRLKRPRVTYF